MYSDNRNTLNTPPCGSSYSFVGWAGCDREWTNVGKSLKASAFVPQTVTGLDPPRRGVQTRIATLVAERCSCGTSYYACFAGENHKF